MNCILKAGAGLVVSSMLAVCAHAILVIPEPERKPLNEVQLTDVINRSFIYVDFLDALFSPRNVMHSLDKKQYTELLNRVRKAHTGAAHWLGITPLSTKKEKRLRYGAWAGWGAPLAVAVFQLDPGQFFEWLVGYPPVLQIFLHNYLMPFPGEIRRATTELISSLGLPAGLPEENMIWYQLGAERDFQQQPRSVQGLVSFDVLEKLVTDVFGRSRIPSDALVEKWLFNVAAPQPWVLEGWLWRFIQRNPEGLEGRIGPNAPIWSHAFRNHLLSNRGFWLKRTDQLLEMFGTDNPESVPAVAHFREQLQASSLYFDFLPAQIRYRGQRACQALFLWTSELRVKP